MKKFNLFIIFLLFLLFVNAASVSLSGTKTISPGDTTALSIIVSDNDMIKGAQMKFDLSGNDFEILPKKTSTSYMSLVSTEKELYVMVKDFANSNSKIPNKGTLAKIYVKAKANAAVGSTATLTLKNVILSTSTDGTSANDEAAANHSITLTVGEPKSTNNFLGTLEVSDYNISFDKNKTDYTLDVNEPGAALKVKATAEDTKATVKVSSPVLVEGTNKITVTVTSESGAKKVYTIVVNVPKKETSKEMDCNLQNLEVTGYDLGFSPNKTEYLLNLDNSVKSIEIKATLENPESSKSINGPKELIEGENIYVITVTDKEGNKKEYRITVNRREAPKVCEECKECEECEESDQVWKYLAIALVIVTLAETIYMVTMRDKKQIWLR